MTFTYDLDIQEVQVGATRRVPQPHKCSHLKLKDKIEEKVERKAFWTYMYKIYVGDYERCQTGWTCLADSLNVWQRAHTVFDISSGKELSNRGL